MKRFALAALLTLLSACSASSPPVLAPSPGPDDPSARAADAPYRPVMAGTAHHGLGRMP